jgi:hypothetical protein
MRTPQELLEQYRSAFTRADVNALVGCFAFPLQVISVADGGASHSVASAEEWPGVLKRLLGAYRRLGVADCVPLAVEVSELVDAVAVVRVHWALRRQDGERVYDFTAAYTLAFTGGRFRIVMIAHDELRKMQAALQGLDPARRRLDARSATGPFLKGDPSPAMANASPPTRP